MLLFEAIFIGGERIIKGGISVKNEERLKENGNKKEKEGNP